MAQRMIPRHHRPPYYYFKRTEHGMERRLAVEDENGRYVPAPENPPSTTSSKLSDAERARLKTVLKNALENVNYAESSFGFGEAPAKPLVVLNVAASEGDFRGFFYPLVNEILNEDSETKYRFTTRLLNSMQKNRDSRRHLDNYYSQPPWYLGFWDKTYFQIYVSQQSDLYDIVAHVTFEFGIHLRKPTLKFDLFNSTDTPNTLTISSTNGPYDVPGELWQTIVWGENSTTILTVFNSDQWEGQVTQGVLKSRIGLGGNFYTTDRDLFETVKVTLEAVKDCVVERIAIVYNKQTILDEKFTTGMKFVAGQKVTLFDLGDRIATYRRNSLLYVPENSLDGKAMKRGKSQYNPSEIINNKPLQKAAAVIGAGWYGGYGAPWTQIQQDGNWNWNPIPSNWCAKFAIWAMTEAGLFQSGNDPLPYIIDAEPMVITDWFIRNNRYLYSFPAPYRDTDRYWHIAHKPTPYSQLGGMVKPGSYCYVRGHAAMFLYWIKPRDTWNKWGLNPRRLDMDDIDPLRSYDNFAKALIHTKPSFYCEPPTSDGEPGDFKADYDINWFAAICGNATMSVYWRFIGAVIHWRTWHWPLMKILAHRHSAEFVPWFEKGESGDEEDVGRLPPIWPPDKGEAPWPLDDNDLCKTYSSPEFRTDLLDKNFKAKFGALPNVTGFGLVY